MHRARINKRRVIILRIVAYAVTLTLSVLTTALLIYAAMGYRLTRSGGVVRSGLLLVDSMPIKSNISIDGQNRSTAPGRFVLTIGSYDLELQSDGYRPWRNTVDITPSQVERIRYPILVPEKLNTRRQIRFSEKSLNPDVSPDRKRLLAQIGNTAVMRLVVFNDKEPKTSLVDLTDIIGSQAVSVEVAAWSPNTRRAIVSYTRDKNTRHLLLNLDNVDSSRVIPSSFRLDSAMPVYFRGNDHFYAVDDKKALRYFNFNLDDSSLLLDSVEAYEVTSNDRQEVAFIRTSDDQKRFEIGASSGDEDVVLDAVPVANKLPLVATFSYDGAWYVVISSRQGQTKIYRNPLGKPLLDNQLPFATINFSAADIAISQYGRFIMMQNQGNVYTYDVETLQSNKFQLKNARQGSLAWMTDFQLAYRDESSNLIYMLDFDGSNRQPLIDDNLVIMGSDKKTIYSLSESSLSTTSLLIE